MSHLPAPCTLGSPFNCSCVVFAHLDAGPTNRPPPADITPARVQGAPVLRRWHPHVRDFLANNHHGSDRSPTFSISVQCARLVLLNTEHREAGLPTRNLRCTASLAFISSSQLILKLSNISVRLRQLILVRLAPRIGDLRRQHNMGKNRTVLRRRRMDLALLDHHVLIYLRCEIFSIKSFWPVTGQTSHKGLCELGRTLHFLPANYDCTGPLA